MPGLAVEWSGPAIRDLADLRAHVAAENPEAAGRVAALIVEASRALGNLPRRGRPGRVPGTRELVIPALPWLLIYEIGEDRVSILRVMHQARLWPPG